MAIKMMGEVSSESKKKNFKKKKLTKAGENEVTVILDARSIVLPVGVLGWMKGAGRKRETHAHT